MAYVDTPASRTASFQAGVDDAVVVHGIRTSTPKGEIAPGVDGLGQWAALAQVGSALLQTGAQVYMAKQDKKEAAKNADRQQQMANDEANRQAKLATDLADRQAKVELAKAGLDAQGKPIPGRPQGILAKVPGGWLTIGGGIAVVGLIAVMLMMRRGGSSAPAAAPKTNPRRRR